MNFSFCFIDGKIIFHYDELEQIENKIFKEQIQKLRVGLDAIANDKTEFDKYAYILFRIKHEIPGNYQTKTEFEVVVFNFNEESQDDMKSFKKAFYSRYIHKIKTEKNLLKVQRFHKNETHQIQYYSDLSTFENSPKAVELWSTETHEGLVLSTEKIASPAETKYSFRYSQVIDCHPKAAHLAKSNMNPDKARSYQQDDGCLTVQVAWDSKPFYDLFCSPLPKPAQYAIEAKIISATIFKSCFAQGMNELVNQIKNSQHDLSNIESTNLKKFKYVNILEEVKNSDYNKFVSKNSQFYKDYEYLKPNAQKYINELAASSENKSESSQSQSSSSSSYSESSHSEFQSMSKEKQTELSKHDVDDYIEKNSATTKEASTINLNELIERKFAKIRQQNSSYYTHKNEQYSNSSISSGSIIQKNEESVQEIITRVTEEFKKTSNNSQMTYIQYQKLISFIKQYAYFFTEMRRKNIKIDTEFIRLIEFKSFEEIIEIYYKKFKDPKFQFIYEKEYDNREVKKTEVKTSSWDNSVTIKETFNEEEKVPGLPKVKYWDVSEDTIETRGGGGSHYSIEIEHRHEEYDEPPIEEEKSNSTKITLAVPPKIKPRKPIYIPPKKPSSSGDSTPPPENPPSLKCGDNEFDICSSSDPDQNPPKPPTFDCRQCIKGCPTWPDCKNKRPPPPPPDCPDGGSSCCIPGRPNYPSCLCTDDSNLDECCKKNPNHEKCKNKDCDPTDECCMSGKNCDDNPPPSSDDSSSSSPPSSSSNPPDFEPICTEPNCAKPCLNPPCCDGENDPKCKKVDPPTPTPPPEPSSDPSSEPPSDPPSDTPEPPADPPKTPKKRTEVLDILEVTSKRSIKGSTAIQDYNGEHSIASLSGALAEKFRSFIEEANKSDSDKKAKERLRRLKK